MTEAELLREVRAAARWLGLAFYHTRDSRGSDAGFPDCVITGRRMIIRELKSESGSLTLQQDAWLRNLRLAGVDAGVWRPASWPDTIMLELRSIAWFSAGPRLP